MADAKLGGLDNLIVINVNIMNFIKKLFGENKQKEKKNISYELFMAFENYFLGDVEAKTFPELGGYTDVVIGLNYLPFVPATITDNERGEILKKYGFQSATALAEDFRKRVLNDHSSIPEHFEKEGIGYVYLFIAAYDSTYNRTHIFGIHSYVKLKHFEITYYDLDNDLTYQEREDYNNELEYFSQAKGYRWLNPKSDDFADKLAWEALEEIATEIYCQMEDKLGSKLDIKPIEKEEIAPATQEDLAKFLVYCGANQEDIDENIERLFSSLENFKFEETDSEFLTYSQIVQYSSEIANFIGEYGNAVYSDWKFYPEDLEYAVLQLTEMEDWQWEYPADTYSADLFPSIRKELYRYRNWLCHFDEGNDGYLFLLFSEDDMPEITRLAQKLKLPLRVFFR